MPKIIAQIPKANIEIIAAKSFHHNNLILELEYLTDFKFWHINIHSVNTKTDISIFGIFVDLQSAIKKFDMISL